VNRFLAFLIFYACAFTSLTHAAQIPALWVKADSLIAFGNLEEAARVLAPQAKTLKGTGRLLWIYANNRDWDQDSVLKLVATLRPGADWPVWDEMLLAFIGAEAQLFKDNFFEAQLGYQKGNDLFIRLPVELSRYVRPWQKKMLATSLTFCQRDDKALPINQEALLLYQKYGKKGDTQIGYLLNNLGINQQMLGLFAASRVTLLQGVAFNKKYQKDPADLADLWLNIGKSYKEEGLLDSAIVFYVKSSELLATLSADNKDAYIRSLVNIAVAYESKGDDVQFLAYSNKAYDWMDKNQSRAEQEYRGLVLLNQAMALLNLDRNVEAERKGRESLAFYQFSRDGKGKFFYKSDITDLVYCLGVMAKILVKSGEKAKLNEAIGFYDNLMGLLDYVREFQESNYPFLQDPQTRELIGDAIEANILMYQKTQNQSNLDRVLAYMTSSTGYTLTQRMYEMDLADRLNLPKQLLEQGHKLRFQISVLSEKLRSETDSLVLIKLNKDLVVEEAKYQDYVQKIKVRYPVFYQFRLQTVKMTVDMVRQNLQTGQAMIQFHVGVDHVYRLVITQKESFAAILSSQHKLRGMVDAMSKSLTSYFYSAERDDALLKSEVFKFRSASYGVYQRLLSDIAPKLPHRLLFIADGFLTSVPFNCLVTKWSSNDSSSKPTYLIEHFAISYTYSPTALWYTRPNEPLEASRQPKSLVVSAGYDKSSQSYLPFIESEKQSFRKFFSSRILEGNEACAEKVLGILPDYKHIHFCSHLILNEAKMEESYLELGRCEALNEHSRLYLKDLYSQFSNIDILSINGCEASNGRYLTGEGAMSMAHGFSYMGVRNLLATSWKVTDIANSDLTIMFYKQVKQGVSEDEALRKAQLAWIRKEEGLKAMPYFWASYRLYAGSYPKSLIKNQVYFAWTLGILGFISIWGLVRKQWFFD
jgi:CHAT domain-containing protein